jgi:hypothetical protein
MFSSFIFSLSFFSGVQQSLMDVDPSIFHLAAYERCWYSDDDDDEDDEDWLPPEEEEGVDDPASPEPEKAVDPVGVEPENAVKEEVEADEEVANGPVVVPQQNGGVVADGDGPVGDEAGAAAAVPAKRRYSHISMNRRKYFHPDGSREFCIFTIHYTVNAPNFGPHVN